MNMTEPTIVQGPKGDQGLCGMQGPSGPPGWVGLTRLPRDISLKGSGKDEMQVGELVDFVKVMQERMRYISPNFEKHAKYPALKELYYQYQVMSRLINDDHNPE
jgi:hypothetical protein